jgi:apolipoprotein D and lipocalin family protein
MGFFATLLTVFAWIVGIAAVGLLALFIWSQAKSSKEAEWAAADGLAAQQLHIGQVDLQRYAGRWYEIAALPNTFERDCICATADYTVSDSGKTIAVLNRCQSDKVKEAKAVAWSNNPDNTWLKVNFLPERLLVSPENAKMLPFSIASGDYWILHVDADYGQAIVGSPDKQYLWILSRAPALSTKDYARLAKIAHAKGYDVNSLQLTCNLLLD